MTATSQNIQGYLYGVVCAEPRIWDRLADAEIFALPSGQATVNADSLARPYLEPARQVAHDVSEARIEEISRQALHARTDAEGHFAFDSPEYKGEPLEIYAVIDRVPTPTLPEPHAPLKERACVALGTFRPVREEGGWHLVCLVPCGIWCSLRRRADLWVICGRVESADGTVGIGGVDVTAFDTDITQDDDLGTATTNANGFFRIDYPGSRFRKGTILNIEMFGGPDVYFRIADGGGSLLLDEARSRGRQADRADRGSCFCVSLRVDVEGPGVEAVPGVWTGVGTAFTIPDTAGLNDFDADGYAGAAKYALTSVIRMTGSAPRLSGAHPVEYRFLVSDSTTANGGASPPAAAFSRIVGVGTDANLFVPTKIGEMVRYSPFQIVKVTARLADLDANGWLDVNASIERTFLAHPTLTPADIPDFVWVDSDALMAIDTRELTTEADVPAAAANPGDAVPPADQIALERKAFRFEIREVIDKSTSTFLAMPGSGATVNAIVLNNNPAFMRVAMTDHLSGTSCSPLSGSPTVAFTVYHPHLRDVSIRVRSNDGTYDHGVSDGTIPISGNVSPAVDHAFNPVAALPGTLHKCTYIVTLRVLRRLHTGDDAVIANTPQTSFYYEP